MVFNIGFLDLFQRDSDNENPIFHGSLNRIHLHVLRNPEPSHELAAAPLHAIPSILLVFFLDVLSPLIWRTLSSSTSNFTSSFFSPGTSALNTFASGVSFQSILVFMNAEGKEERESRLEKANPWKGPNHLWRRDPRC